VAERAAGARPVLDHHGLAELFLQRLRDDAADDVGAAAGSERNDHAERPLRPLLRRGGARAEEPCSGDGEQVASREHQRSSLGPRRRALGRAAIVHAVAHVVARVSASNSLYRHLAGPATRGELKQGSGVPWGQFFSSVLFWKIAPAHRIADGGGRVEGPQFFQHVVELALDLVQAAQDQRETAVGGHDFTASEEEAPAGGGWGACQAGASVAERIELGLFTLRRREKCAGSLLLPHHGRYRLVALPTPGDLFICAKDLFVDATTVCSPWAKTRFRRPTLPARVSTSLFRHVNPALSMPGQHVRRSRSRGAP